MPSRFRLSGFFEHARPGLGKPLGEEQQQQQQQQQSIRQQDADARQSAATATTTFHASHGAIFQLDEVVRPRTARASTISRRYSYLDRRQHDSANHSYFGDSTTKLANNHINNSNSSNSSASNSNSNSSSSRRNNSHRTIKTQSSQFNSNSLVLLDDDHDHTGVHDSVSMAQQQQILLPLQMNHVKNVLAEYCFALDNKQYDKVAKLFAPNCLAFYNAVAPLPGTCRAEKGGIDAMTDSAGGAQGLRGREAVVKFLRGRTHDKTTIHALSTQHLEFEYSNTSGSSGTASGQLERLNNFGGLGASNGLSSGSLKITACIAKTYFTANTFTIPDWQRQDVPFVHTVQHGQYVDVLRPSNTSSGGNDGHGGWEIHHRRVIVVVPRLIQPSMLANGSHEQIEQWLIAQRANQIKSQQEQSTK